MLNIIKKQGIGTWISLATLLITVIGLIIYGVVLGAATNLLVASGSEPFYDSNLALYSTMTTTVTACGIISILLIVGAIVASQLKLEGTLGTVCNALVSAARILVPVLLMLVLLYFLYGSFTGLGWTFFSNEELQIYPEAVTAGKQVITGLIFFGIATVAGIVASFFAMVKKEQA